VHASTVSTQLYEVWNTVIQTSEQWTTVISSREAYRLSAKSCQLDNVACEGHAWTLVAIHLAAVQQITDFWLLSVRLQRRPLLKKHWLDASQMKSYRPVSNMSFLSKLLERTVQIRFQTFLDSNSLMPRTKSAYREFHSTEIVVTRVYNDMLIAANSGQDFMCALCLLDLSTAFDMVDHNVLML